MSIKLSPTAIPLSPTAFRVYPHPFLALIQVSLCQIGWVIIPDNVAKNRHGAVDLLVDRGGQSYLIHHPGNSLSVMVHCAEVPGWGMDINMRIA